MVALFVRGKYFDGHRGLTPRGAGPG
jgi:hypothetical protein